MPMFLTHLVTSQSFHQALFVCLDLERQELRVDTA